MVEIADLFDQFTLITQNVDGLHAQAGSTDLLELHGNINNNKCVQCGAAYPVDKGIDPDAIPSCPHCGGSIRPDVVWFGEMLDAATIQSAFEASARADLFLSVGTSALVHPAASLPYEAKNSGALLIEINPEPTPLSELADFRIAEASGEFLPRFVEALKSTGDQETDGAVK